MEFKKSEKRKASRVKFIHSVILRRGDKKITAELENISLSGMYVKLKNPGAVCISGEDLGYEIVLSPAGSRVKISGIARVARGEKKGCGLYFIRMKDTDLEHIRRVIEMNYGSFDIVRRELKSLIKKA